MARHNANETEEQPPSDKNHRNEAIIDGGTNPFERFDREEQNEAIINGGTNPFERFDR
jgi:hypothetical protein